MTHSIIQHGFDSDKQPYNSNIICNIIVYKFKIISMQKSSTTQAKQQKTYEDPDLENREEKKHQMVMQMHKKNKQSGAFQTINDIFYRLPLPRLQKNSYRFLFDNVKEGMQTILEQQNQVQQLQALQQQLIDHIQVKLGKPATLPDEQALFKEKLPSGNALFKSLIYMRNQKKEYGFKQFEGDLQPFLLDSHYINLEKIQKQIPNVRLFLEDGKPVKHYTFEFVNENQILFKDQSFPSTYEMDRRAQVLAKLYLLDLYRQQARKLLIIDRNDQNELEKKRQINKIKQQMEIQKMKEGELIQDMDLLKQVYKIVQWIEKKMNALAYEQFKSKNGERATQIKKSLEKLKNTVNAEIVPMNKLKILISYKYKKGW